MKNNIKISLFCFFIPVCCVLLYSYEECKYERHVTCLNSPWATTMERLFGIKKRKTMNNLFQVIGQHHRITTGINNVSIRNSQNYTIRYRRIDASYKQEVSSMDGNESLQHIHRTVLQRPGITWDLVLTAPEIFRKVPPTFLDNFKNPCWIEGDNELNCLPYFYIIGMFKCGTTDVWDKLSLHPDVVMAPKEPHWWGPRRNGYKGLPIHAQLVLETRKRTGGKDDRSFEWYLNLYKKFTVPALLKKTVTREDVVHYPGIFGDASISTAFTLGMKWRQDFPNADEPPFTNADLIHAIQPNAKIVMILRNPTKRAISWWWYSYKNGNASGLHHSMLHHINCFKTCLQSHKLRYCCYAAGCPYSEIPNIQVGIYHVYLRDWIKSFGINGVHVVHLEDWQTNTVEVYRKLLDFVNLRQLSDEQERQILTRGRKNVNKRSNRKTTWPETERLLNNFFSPFSDQLSKILGDVY